MLVEKYEKYTTVIVTAFFPNTNNNRSVETYLNYGKLLLENNIPKIVFSTKEIINELPKNEFTHYVNYNLKFPSHECKLPQNRNIEKDTQNYLFLMNQKTLFINHAITLNIFPDILQYLWVDFGIGHVCKKENVSFYLENMVRQKYDQVRIAHIWSLKNIVCDFENIQWYFAGGVFGGHRNSLLLFHKYASEIFQKMLTSGKLVWEVNVWAQVFKEHLEIFNPYISDHNDTILSNY